MNAKELRTKDAAALTKELQDLQRAHFSLRMQLATQQISNTSQLGKTKRDIARTKTVINEVARKVASK
jgi:large subunit ribosomal protein L29